VAKLRCTYTREFKAETVMLITERGYSVAEAARSLGVHETLVSSWKQVRRDQGDQASPGQGNPQPSTCAAGRLLPLPDGLPGIHPEGPSSLASGKILAITRTWWWYPHPTQRPTPRCP
jgi:transposase